MSKSLFVKKSAGRVEVSAGAEQTTGNKPVADRKDTQPEARKRCGPEVVQLNIHLPTALHRRLRLEGIRRGKPLAETLTLLLSNCLPAA